MFVKRLLVSPVRLLGNNVRFMLTKSLSDELVLTEEVNDKGLVILNRPKAMNATTTEMLERLDNIFNDWKDTKSLIIVRGNGEKAFCAGGDVRTIIEDEQRSYGRKYLKVEYAIINTVGNMKIPCVALIDGITMGMGVGLSIHGKYRVATERTIFAMPETRIGFFPDIGSTYFLPRLQGKLGYYLGMTGSSLKGADVFHAGIATHYCDSAKIPLLEHELLQLNDTNDVGNVINDFCPKPQSQFRLAKNIDKINECFDATSVEEIISKLQKDNSEWATKTLTILRTLCPTSLKVTFRQLSLGSKMNSLDECLQMEYLLGFHFLHDRDFGEGVRALLIDKDNAPKWNPANVEDVSSERVLSFFKPLSSNHSLKIATA